MATTTTGLVDAKIVVNAYGQSAGGVWPHFRLMIDGIDAGQATVSATTPNAYSFTAPVAPAQAHKVQVFYDNDGSVNGADRNLYVKSVVVNGNTMLPTQAVYNRNALDGLDTVAGQEGMWWQGALNFSTPAAYYPAPVAPAPAAGTSGIVVNAHGTAAGGAYAHFNLLVDGRKVGEGTTTGTAKDFAFTADVTADQAHKVQVQYDNDGYVNGADRNLFVHAVTINGKAVAPADPVVAYDKGALDGKDVAAGQSGMYWGGTLVVSADKSYFPAPTTPATPAGASTIVVNAHGSPAGGVNAHFNVLVDGQKVGEGTAGTTAKDYAFTAAAVTPGVAHKVQVQFDNDTYVNGQDRNLFVNTVTVNGHRYAPADPAVSVDKGALDGKDVIPGQSGLYWNGTFVVAAPAADFPGTAPATPTTPTTPATPPAGPAFYVATNGKDTWSGRLAAPNADGTDGPFATLQAAQQAMRAGSVDVTYVRGGDYYMKNQLWLDGQDSGVRFAAYGNEEPVFHGSTKIDTWAPLGNGLWSAKLPAGSKPVLDLTMDGERQTLARTPNADPAHPVDGGWLFAQKNAAGINTATQFTFKPGDIPVMSDTSGLMVNIFTQHGYTNQLVPVQSIDYAKNVVTLAQGTWDSLGEGSRYHLFNTRGQLDAPGEWYYDRTGNQILFRPEGGTPAGHTIVAAQLPVLGGIGGAQNVTIDGLTFTDGGPDGHGWFVDRGNGLTFTGNTLTNVGYGISVQNSTGVKITGNAVDDVAREGIFLKAGSNGSEVSGNRVTDAGTVEKGSAGIMALGTSDTKITHNEVERAPHAGIMMGSVEGASDASYRNTIAYNSVKDANRETSDGGGIYLLGRQQDMTGHVIEHNEVTGTTAFGNVRWDGSLSPTFLPADQLVSWGIYLDDWTSGATVRGNVVAGNAGGGVFLHGGWNNEVSNNIVAGNTGHQIGLQQSVGYGGWKGTPMTGNVVHDNLIDVSKGAAVHIDGPGAVGRFASNDYAALDPDAALFHAWPQLMASGYGGTLANWQAAGYDRDSVVVNPLFTDPQHGDYSLQAGSPVYQHGFEPLPMDQFGVMA